MAITSEYNGLCHKEHRSGPLGLEAVIAWLSKPSRILQRVHEKLVRFVTNDTGEPPLETPQMSPLAMMDAPLVIV